MSAQSTPLQDRLRRGVDVERAERSKIAENHRTDKLRLEAANELDRLTARCAELEGALRGVLSELDRIGNAPATDQCQQHWDVDTETTITVARAALAKVTT